MIFPVILCGGSGERLWPLSRKSYPKQFLQLVGKGSLFQQSASRFSCETVNSIIVTNEDYRFIVRQQLQDVGLAEADVIIEADGKDTAPAILAAALHVEAKDPSGVMVVMPSDHYIPDQGAFTSLVKHAAENIPDGQIMCLGIQPSRPETGYGYIKVNNIKQQIYEVEQFIEKPSLEIAEEYLSGGVHLWNAGIFIVRAGNLLKLAEALQPEMLQAVGDAYNKSKNDLDFIRLDPQSWRNVEGNSFDYAFMEKASSICCMRFDGDWSDLGDWNSVAREKNTDLSGNNLIGNAYQIDSRDSLLWSDSNNQVLTGLGLDNIIAVATSDAVLVANKSKSQEIKTIIKNLKNSNQSQASEHLFEHRPWGNFRTVAKDENFHIKIINVFPSGKLSLQSHKYRSEHWVVVAGVASVVRGEEKFDVHINKSIYIDCGVKHQLINEGKENLRIIEIQVGSYFGEDDIVRYDDQYGRN